VADVRRLLRLQTAAADILSGVDAIINETADSRRSSPVQHVALDMGVARPSPQEIDMRGTSLQVYYDFGQGRQFWGTDNVNLWLNTPAGDPIPCPPAHAHNGVDLDDVPFDKLFVQNATALAGCTMHLYAGWATRIRYRGVRWYTPYSVTLQAPGFTASDEIVLPPSIERCILLVPDTTGANCWLEVSPTIPGATWYRATCPIWPGAGANALAYPHVFNPNGANYAVDITAYVAGLNNCSVRIGSVGAGALTFAFHVRGLYL